MTTKIFDTMIISKNETGYIDVEDTIDKLDEMLTSHDIAHAFTLPTASVFEETPTAAAVLHYCSEDGMAVSLIYALHSNLYRGIEDERLAEALVRVANSYLPK